MKKRISILAIVLCSAVSLLAQYHKTTDNRVNHYINFSIGGGETNLFSHFVKDAPKIEDMPGGDGLFGITYEMRKGSLIFGLGAQLDYDYTWHHIDSFANVFDRLDRTHEEIFYEYCYKDYTDRQHNLQLSIPLYFGVNIGHYVYLLAGAKVSLSFLAQHQTETLLATQGTYKRFIHTIQNAPTYGYYYQDTYSYKSAFEAPSLKVSPILECGARIPVESRSKRIGMRLGGYIEYGIPLDMNNKMDMVDYRMVDKSPFTQTQDNLRENIVFNSVVNSSFQSKAFSQFTVGIKWTVLFNVTPPDHVCMCDGD